MRPINLRRLQSEKKKGFAIRTSQFLSLNSAKNRPQKKQTTGAAAPGTAWRSLWWLAPVYVVAAAGDLVRTIRTVGFLAGLDACRAGAAGESNARATSGAA
jgi:hypothetical protein